MKFDRLILVSFLCVLLADAVNYMFVAMQLGVGATYITAVLKFTSLFVLLYLHTRTKWEKHMPAHAKLYFNLLIAWNVITIIRGVFTAKGYWDWKYLVLDTSLSLLVPYALILGIMFEYSRRMFSFIVTKLFLYGFLIIPLTIKLDPVRELFARGTVISVSFFILLSPYFKFKWRVLTFIVAAVSIYLSFDFRTNVIRICVATMIFTLYYVRRYIAAGVMKTACLICFAAPLLFLFLATTNQFNIFHPTDNIDKFEYAYENGDEKNVAQDTRTFLYEEEFASMNANNSFIMGEGAAGTYKTEFFEDVVIKDEGRTGSEVGFLNTLLYAGIIGVLLHACMLFSACYYAVNYSNNFLCKMLGLFIAFRWVLFFIEDFGRYDMNYYFIWLAVGLCFSKRFRALTDADLSRYFNFKLADWQS